MKRNYWADELIESCLTQLNPIGKNRVPFNPVFRDLNRDLHLISEDGSIVPPMEDIEGKFGDLEKEAVRQHFIKYKFTEKNIQLLGEYYDQIFATVNTFITNKLGDKDIFLRVIPEDQKNTKKEIFQKNGIVYVKGTYDGISLGSDPMKTKSISDSISYEYELTNEGLRLISLTVEGQTLNDHLSDITKSHFVARPIREAKILKTHAPKAQLQPHPIELSKLLIHHEVTLASEQKLRTSLNLYRKERDKIKNEYFYRIWFKGHSKTDKFTGLDYVKARLNGTPASELKPLTDRQKRALFSSTLGNIIKNRESQTVLRKTGILEEIQPQSYQNARKDVLDALL